MCIGLTVLFRDRLNTQGRFVNEMAKSTFAVYILHILVVVPFQVLALRLVAPPLLKFLLVTLFSIPTSYTLGSLIRRPLRL
jgi:surface polysaccharide O-acyltransferase-like enzyme